MNFPIFSLQWFAFFFLISLTSITATLFNIPRLSPIGGKTLQLQDPETVFSAFWDDYQTFYYNQTLDHFNYRPESYTSFQQRYAINFKYWGGATSNAPIFVHLGAEAPLNDIPATGFLTDDALQFKALLVYIEVLIVNFKPAHELTVNNILSIPFTFCCNKLCHKML